MSDSDYQAWVDLIFYFISYTGIVLMFIALKIKEHDDE